MFPWSFYRVSYRILGFSELAANSRRDPGSHTTMESERLDPATPPLYFGKDDGDADREQRCRNPREALASENELPRPDFFKGTLF